MTEPTQRLFALNEARRVSTEDRIMAIPSPEFTPTWRPYSHRDVKEATEIAITELGLKIEKKTYSVSQDGNNVHALVQLTLRKEGKLCCLGWRNSLNKEFSIGYCEVFTILFCTNQMTPGSYFLLRRHSGKLSIEELSGLARNAVERVVGQFDSLHLWHEELKGYRLSAGWAESLTVQAMRDGALSLTKFNEFDSLMFGTGTPYEMNLHGFHGALTQLIRENHFRIQTEMNSKITTFINWAKTQTFQRGL